jgi:cell division protein FtsB
MNSASNHIIHMLAGDASDSDDDPMIFDDYEADDALYRTSDPVPKFRAEPVEPSLIFRGSPDEEAPEVLFPQDTHTVKKAVSFEDVDVTENWSENEVTEAKGDTPATTAGGVPNTENSSNLVQQVPLQEPVSSTEPFSTHEPSKPASYAGLSPESPATAVALTMSGASELSSRPPDTPKGHSVITIEHTTAASSTSKSAAFLLGMSKPVFAIVAFTLLFTTTSAIVFFAQFLRIPGLDNQISALTSQVDRLEAEVQALQTEINRLSSEVDRLGLEVDDLSLENDRLVVLNDGLKAENSIFSDFVQQFNGTNTDIEDWIQNITNATASLSLQVGQLTDEKEALKNSTVFLENEVGNLQDQADALNRTNVAVEATNKVLKTQVQELNADISNMNQTNKILMNQNYKLNATVETLNEENAGLKAQVDRLEAVLGFLNETGNNGTFQEVTQELNNLITSNQNLVLTGLQNQYLSRVDFWLCSYLSAFSGMPFVVDPTLAIGATDYSSVIANVNSGALEPLCLNRSNFEDFVKVNFLKSLPGLPRPYNASTNKLRSAVTQYTTRALNYYFPENGEVGISPQEWAQANYSCTKLASNLAFAVAFN